MTERSPIPACLSHLTQRDAAVRARALEEVTIASPPRDPTEVMVDAIHSVHRPGFAVTWYKVWTTMYDAWDRERRALIPTPPVPLTQRDAAVRARALEEAAIVVSHQSTAASECWLGMSGQFKLGHITARDEAMAAIRALLPTPPASVPDEAAIRAELVAALRDARRIIVTAGSTNLLKQIDAVLAKNEGTP